MQIAAWEGWFPSFLKEVPSGCRGLGRSESRTRTCSADLPHLTPGHLVSKALTRPLAPSKSYSHMTDQLCTEPVSLPSYPGKLDLERQKAHVKHS